MHKRRGESFGNVSEAPDQDAGVTEGGESVGRAIGLGTAEVAGPLALELVIPHLVKPAGGIEKETKGVLGDGVVVETGAGGDGDLGGVEAGAENVIGTGGERLDPAQLGQTVDGIFEVVGGVGPGDEDLSVDVFLSRLRAAVGLNTFMVGMIKAPFMALVIGIIATIEGLAVEGSAESLGRHVTSSVVKAIFMVIVLDGLFAMFFAAIRY